MMIGDKMPPSSIHQQRDTPERYAMIVFEDQIFNRQYLGKGFRRTMYEKFHEILGGEGFLPPDLSNEQKLPASKLVQTIAFLTSSIQHNSNEPTPRDNVLKYIVHCLEMSMRIALRTWNSKGNQDTSFLVTTLTNLQKGKSRFRWKNDSTLNQDSSNEFLVFWCMDTDGLHLDVEHLNKARSLNVTPLCPFFESSVKSLRYHLPQNTVSRRLLKKSKNFFPPVTNNGLKGSGPFLEMMGGYEGTDHFFLFLTPNAEALQYQLTEASVSKLRKYLTRDYPNRDYPDVPKPIHGTDLFLHLSLLSSEDDLNPNSKAAFRDRLAVVEHLTSDKKMALTWDRENIESLHASIRPKNDWEVSALISAGLYVNKGQIKPKTKPKNKLFPIKKSELAPQIKIEEMVSVFKWSTTLSSSYGRDKKDPCIVSAWTDDLNRCNGKTKIPMMKVDSEARQVDPDRAERQRDLLLKYGENCYGGFQPCQRIVKNKLRCVDHT